MVCAYEDVFAAGDHVPEILEHQPLGLEGLDDVLIDDMRTLGMHVEDLRLLPEGKGWLLAEFGGETREEADDRARKCMKALGKAKGAPRMELYDKPPNEAKLWDIRESGLGATAFLPGHPDHWEGWEDAAVPPAELGSYLRGFRDLLGRYDYRTALYGHFGDGCVHCRINFDLGTVAGLRKWRAFIVEAADLVLQHGGSLSGEHGDGQSRGELSERMYGAELVEAFREMKSIWDPEGRMNPHKVVDPYPIVSNLKLGAGYNPAEPKTHFSYPEDDGRFAHAALRCVGAGKCRDASSGTMCPSYMVTLDEQHSTRGRARILYEMLEGETIADGFRSDDVHEALDLCLSCKGCKGDCPVSVDMATYKAEFLSRYYRRRLRPLSAYAMGLIPFHARLAARAPGLVNALAGAPGLGALLKRAGGIAREREMPPFAAQTFTGWFAERGAVNPGGPPVVLFPDTFNNHLHPEPLKATAEALEDAGYRVVLPARDACCGRPLYDYGMLDTAKLFWRRTLDILRPHLRDGNEDRRRRAELRRRVPRRVAEPDHGRPRREAPREAGPDPAGVSPRRGRGLAAPPARAQGDRARPLPPPGGHGLRHRARAPRADRARRRGARLGLLRDGGGVRLRGGALRRLGRGGGASSASRCARGSARGAHRRRRLLLQDADRAADRPPRPAHGPGSGDGPKGGTLGPGGAAPRAGLPGSSPGSSRAPRHGGGRSPRGGGVCGGRPRVTFPHVSESMRRRAILDVDGTLVDSNYHHVIAWQRAFSASGLDVPAWRLHRHVGMGSDRFVGEVAGEDFDAEHGDEVRAVHSKDYEERIEEVALLDGARELIEDLGRRGFEVVLASSADQSEVDRYLELLDAGDLLSGWTTAADVDATKPDSDLVETALGDAAPSDALMIGDTPWDAIAAGKAGVRFLAVLSGGFPEADLREAGAAGVYESLPDLIAALEAPAR